MRSTRKQRRKRLDKQRRRRYRKTSVADPEARERLIRELNDLVALCESRVNPTAD